MNRVSGKQGIRKLYIAKKLGKCYTFQILYFGGSHEKD